MSIQEKAENVVRMYESYSQVLFQTGVWKETDRGRLSDIPDSVLKTEYEPYINYMCRCLMANIVKARRIMMETANA